MNNLNLKRAEPVVDQDDLWTDDVLERRLYAPVLTSLVGDSVEPTVVALNGGWGTGKTFFLNRWGREFERPLSIDGKQGRVIYFSAWQDDDLEDPLLAIIGQLHRNLHARPLKVDEGIEESAQTKAAKVVESANRVLTKLGKHVDNFAEHWTGVRPVEIVKDFSNPMAQRVDAYSEAIDARVDLKERLRDVANNAKVVDLLFKRERRGFLKEEDVEVKAKESQSKPRRRCGWQRSSMALVRLNRPSVERYVRALKVDGLVAFRGVPRIGGDYCLK